MSEEFITAILSKIAQGKNVFLHGPGGTGKTYAIRILIKRLTEAGIACEATALTGIAALGLSSVTAGEANQGKTVAPASKEQNIRGRTLHSFAFGAAWNGNNDSAVKIAASVKNFINQLTCWQTTQVLFIDEVSMMGAQLLELVDAVARLVRNNQQIHHNNPGAPFGGLTVVFSGDFMQLPPVKENFCFSSAVFESFDFFYFIFDKPQRFVTDLPWFYVLQRIRKGKPTKSDIDLLETRFQAWVNLDTKDILQVKPTVLYPTNDKVKALNQNELDKLPGDPVDFKAFDMFEKKKPTANRDSYEKEADLNIDPFIQLKVGAQVMLKVNLSVDEGKVNGSRGVVVEIIKKDEVLPQVRVKWYLGDTSIVSPSIFKKEDKLGIFTRIQIPLILAWSTSIHKSQGVSMDCVVADLGNSIFLGGMAYVVLSRVRTIKGLFLSSFNPRRIYADPTAFAFVQNIEEEQEAEFISPIIVVAKRLQDTTPL